MITLTSYLSNVKANPETCHSVVLGNGAADLDSMVAAVSYGFLCTTVQPERPVLPLIYIPRSEFYFRPEAVYLFAEVGVTADDLIFIDDVDCERLFKKVSLILVDHNKLSKELENYQDQVIAVLDHHSDEGQYLHCQPRFVRKIGSTCSLVTHEFIRNGIAIDPGIATLLAGTILLDTVNLDKYANKATEDDILALEQILPQCIHEPGKLYKKLKFERTNIGHLGMADLLCRDHKEYHRGELCWGISVIPLSRERLGENDEELCKVVEEFIKERGLDLLLLMFVFNDPQFRRQLMIVWPDTGASGQLFSALQVGGLMLCPLAGMPCSMGQGSICGYSCYEQVNTTVSRKGLQPLVDDFLKSREDNTVGLV